MGKLVKKIRFHPGKFPETEVVVRCEISRVCFGAFRGCPGLSDLLSFRGLWVSIYRAYKVGPPSPDISGVISPLKVGILWSRVKFHPSYPLRPFFSRPQITPFITTRDPPGRPHNPTYNDWLGAQVMLPSYLKASYKGPRKPNHRN